MLKNLRMPGKYLSSCKYADVCKQIALMKQCVNVLEALVYKTPSHAFSPHSNPVNRICLNSFHAVSALWARHYAKCLKCILSFSLHNSLWCKYLFQPIVRMEVPRLKALRRFAKVLQLVSEVTNPRILGLTSQSAAHSRFYLQGAPSPFQGWECDRGRTSFLSILELWKAGLDGHFIMFPQNKTLRLKQGGSIVQAGLS